MMSTAELQARRSLASLFAAGLVAFGLLLVLPFLPGTAHAVDSDEPDAASVVSDPPVGDSGREGNKLADWWDDVPETRFYETWSGALLLVLGLAIVIILLLLCLLGTDSWELRRYRRTRRRGSKPPTPQKSRRVLDRWSMILVRLKEKDRSADPETLEHILIGRYEWSESLLASLRTTATLTGLLFTFLGLAITLTDLSAALAGTGQDSVDVQVALSKVREALPSLGTAFASSIFGVLLAIAIGLVEAVLRTWRVRIAARTSVLSAEWLQPHYVLRTDRESMVQLLEAQRKTFGDGLETLGATLEKLHDKADERNSGLLTAAVEAQTRTVGLAENSHKAIERLKTLAGRIEKMPAQADKVWNAILESQKEQHLEVMSSVRSTVEDAGKAVAATIEGARTAVSEELESMRAQAAEGTGALASAMETVRTQGEETLGRLEATSAALEGNATKFGEVTRAAADALEAGSEHVQALRTSAERFRDAMVRLVDIAKQNSADEAKRLEAMEQAFTKANEMTDAVTLSSGAAERAAERLHDVLGGEQMALYLKALPRLAELAESERRSREAFQGATETFVRVAGAIDSLDIHAERIGQTSELLRGAHERLTESMTTLAAEHMLPVIENMLQTTAREVTAQREEAWVGRYGTILEHHEQTLQHHKQTLGEVRRSIEGLDRSQRQLLNWLQKSAWARVFGRGDES